MRIDKSVQQKYINGELEKARTAADAGNATIMETHVSTARIYAQAGIRYISEQCDIAVRIAEIEKIGYDNAVPVELANSRELADAGNAPLMNVSLSLAQQWAKKAGQDISDKLVEIEKVGYEKAVPLQLEDAKGYAEEGRAIIMEQLFRIAEECARRIGQDISDKVAEIGKVGYEKAVPIELAEARKCAEEGNAGGMNNHILFAKAYAQKVGQDVSAQVAETEKIGYEKAVPVELAKATNYANDGGNLCDISGYISIAQIYAQKAGLDISAQVAAINKTGYKNAAFSRLAEARKHAENCVGGWYHQYPMESCLSAAESFARSAGIDISTDVSVIKRKGYEYIVSLALGQARQLAVGDESASCVSIKDHISEARQYAQYIKQDISAQVAEIERMRNAMVVPLRLDEARRRAEAGDESGMKNSILSARIRAKKAEMDISAQVAEIKGLLH